MLDHGQLADLYRTHRNEKILSVYLDTNQQDFAERDRWKLELKNLVAEQRNGAEGSEDFERALAHLVEAMDPGAQRFISGRGWAGFATPERAIYAGGLPTPMPNLVRWEDGLRVAPYVRALKQTRPVVAVIVDSRKARVLRYEEGEIRSDSPLHADTYIGDLTDVNVSKRASGHSGVRGKTGTDAAQKFLEIERDRMIAKTADEVREQLGSDGFLVIGGVERAAATLEKEFSQLPDSRILRRDTLNFDMSDAEIRGVVEEAASELSDREARDTVAELIDRAGAGDRACLGDEDTERALREQRVDTLVVTDRVRQERPDRIDHFEGAAFEQSATVVEVRSDSAAELERQGGGIGALLRYAIRE